MLTGADVALSYKIASALKKKKVGEVALVQGAVYNKDGLLK